MNITLISDLKSRKYIFEFFPSYSVSSFSTVIVIGSCDNINEKRRLNNKNKLIVLLPSIKKNIYIYIWIIKR